jgi:hypothetical protein
MDNNITSITASKLIAILQDRVREYGDLPVTLDGTFSLHDGWDVAIATWTDTRTGKIFKTIDLG